MDRSGPPITVVGGANVDIVGIPGARYLARDSNPGHVRTSPGGVARNIAENLARLGASVRLLTAFGCDADADRLMSGCEELGIDCTHSVRAAGAPCSRYLAVLDDDGDLAAAVNDMRALEALTPERIDPAAFVGARAVVLDANLAPATIVRAADYAGEAPLVLDPVSVAKAEHARPVLGRLTALKANRMEAESLAGVNGPERAARKLVDAGVRWVFVTMGKDGTWCCSAEEAFEVPPLSTEVRNATGAGDAFTAGVAWSLAGGLSFRETAATATALSAIALESEDTVNDQLSAAALAKRMEVSDV